MNKTPFYFFALIILMLFSITDTAHAQRKKKKKDKVISIYDIDTLVQPIPRNRQLWHIKIDAEQKRADVSDGSVDGVIYYSEDSTFNNMLTKAILKDGDRLQVMVENMPSNGRDAVADNQERIRCLIAINKMLRSYNENTRVDPYYTRKLVTNMRDLIIARNEGHGMDFVRNNVNIYTLYNVKDLYDAPGSDEQIYIYTEMGKQEPAMMIKHLSEFANETYADPIIAAAARIVPNQIYDYATSTNVTLSGAIRRNQDPLVQSIVRISQESKSPLKAMPFLNDVYTKKYTIAEIDKITADPDLFYKNLVRLKMENVSLGGNTYTDELQYRGLKYVRLINDLHEEKDPVRFRSIDNFTAPELYFLMVYGQDEIYTSSFLGCFKRMVERMAPLKGNELLDTLHRDKFRTFIRMCAGYNTLSPFLATMEPDKKTDLMRDFIAGLEKGKEDDLEDAVDVADAFGSISDSALSIFLQNQVKENYERSYTQEKSRKGVIIYGLLATLFESSKAVDNTNSAADESERLNLPPINKVPFKSLTNDSGIVYEQFFFYGDKDGKSSYASFLTNFKDGKWKVTTSKYWSTVTSTAGKRIVIYANLPLAEPEDEDAQRELNKYLEEHQIRPSVIVHRGHSYHLPITIDRLTKESKIVMLGSCGGYHNLGTVLDHSPEAHIISSKQVGSMSVNEPIIKAINEQLREGNDIDWIAMWKGLDVYFSGKGRAKTKELFQDYIPPHKNLGAIFIKAYRRMFNTEEEPE
jgi:hypothetical protein